jgi:hypothetical protein
MNRSMGVTVSAVLVFIGSALTLLFGAFSMLAFVTIRNMPPQPAFVRYFMAGVAVFEVAFAIWGILSGIGLLHSREWARISMLVFSGLLLFFNLPGLLIVPLLPMPQPENVPGNFVFAIKLGMGIFYGLLAALGGSWLYLFNKKTVKSQFVRGETSVPSLAHPSRRPLSITIIGWLLVLVPIFALPTLSLRFPVLFLGMVLGGWRAALVMLAWGGAQFAAGVGLLKLRPWGRTLSICVLMFGLFNVLVTILLPGGQARFDQMIAAIQARMGIPMTTIPGLMNSSWRVGLLFGVAFVAVQLWFVVTRKQAFHAEQEASVQSS